MTYGTFDLFHYGHLELLRRAKQLAGDDRLIVGISTDEFNYIKGKKSIIPYEQRKSIVESIKYVDMVIPESCWEQKEFDLVKYGARMLMGDDWKGKFDALGCVYIPRTNNISTTEIISFILNNIDEKQENICSNA